MDEIENLNQAPEELYLCVQWEARLQGLGRGFSVAVGKTYNEPLNVSALTNNQLTGFTYDTAGNMTNNGSAFNYDAENRLVTAGGYTYYYDGDGNRVAKSNGSTGTLYWRGPTGDPISESSITGTSQEEYIFFNGTRIARRDVSGGAQHYYFSDHLGSHAVVENATGSSCEQDIDYYPYGGVVYDYCATVTQHYRFTGKERDTESGLDNFGARYGASALGRFMTPDLVPGMRRNVVEPQRWNLYAYARNNPLAYVDRNGLWPTAIHNEIIEAIFIGLSPEDISLMERVSGEQDSIAAGNQSSAQANIHGQCSLGQDMTSCAGGIMNHIYSNLDAASSRFQDMGLDSGTISYLSIAGHTLSDLGSPSHIHPDGTPTTWPGIAPWYWGSDFSHVLGELDEGLDWAGIGQSVRNQIAGTCYSLPGEVCEQVIGGSPEQAAERAISRIVNQYFATTFAVSENGSQRLSLVDEDAARQCALGNRAACPH